MWSRCRVMIGLGVTAGAGFAWLAKEEVFCAAPVNVSPAPFSVNPAASWVRSVECPYLTWDDNWDRRAPMKATKLADGSTVLAVDEAAPVSKAVRHIILIRHGQYHTNASRDERKLTGLGIQQAHAVGRRLKALGYSYKLPIVSSTLVRAVETANIIREELGVEEPLYQEDLLKEGQPALQIPSRTPYSLPQEISVHVDSSRIEAAFRSIFYRPDPTQKENTYELVVCHANVIRYFVCRVLQFPPERWICMNLGHCSITWITIKGNGRVTLRSFGDSGFMPPNIMTTVS